MKPYKIQFDREFEEDGLYSITFWFNAPGEPSYISVARDEIEEPDFAYVEAEDQIYGFKTNDLDFTRQKTTITLKLKANSKSEFHWNHAKEVTIEVPEEEMDEVERYLKRICL